jgi:signal transduction histidine kinase
VDGGSLLAARLSPPLSDIALDFAAGRLDRGPGFSLLVWTAVTLGAVLIGGFVSMYLFGMQQLKLAREQRSFVSAVSHELKTPLTSIRMYGEMLKSGWADESKKMAYYDFIVTEGERLSRLIDNVLQLARLNNGGAAVEPVPVSVAEIFDLLRSKLTTQAERAGFALEFEVADTVGALGIAVDTDALTQVFINLVDNAIKFSADADRRTIGIAARRNHAGQVMLTVRDYGPGVPPAALKRLFELFYRPDNELTRTTSGTGIGLALVRQLVTAMGGRVDVRNCEPGAEFRLSFAEFRLAET